MQILAGTESAADKGVHAGMLGYDPHLSHSAEGL